MAKTTKTTISSGFNSNSAINDNFDRIDTELNNKVLYRDNPTGEPNQMQSDLDMNSNDILNGGSAGFSSLSVNGNNITSTDAAVSTLPDQSGNSGKFLTTNGTTASWDIFVIEFDTKAAMVASTTLSSGDVVRTKGYTSIADNGGAVYIVRTAGEFGGTPDEKGDHTLGNGNVAQLIVNGSTNAYHYGAIGDGVADDSAALDAADNAGNLVLLSGTYKVSVSKTFTSAPVFYDGAKLSVDVGVTLTLRKAPVAPTEQLVFDGAGTYALEGGQPKWAEVSADWFGAGSGDASPSIEAAFNFSDRVLLLGNAYTISTPCNIPDARIIHIQGSGFRTTTLTVATSIVGIDYQRTEDAGGTVLSIDGISLAESGLGKTSTGISFKGFSAGTPGSETKIQDDNWLRLTNSYVVGFNRGVDTHFAGQCHFENNWYQANNASHFMQRGSSFFYFSNCMNLSSANFIYADDTVGDAYSNGLILVNCNSVTCSSTDVRVYGWQAVFIANCGLDLGEGGNSAAYFNTCQDVRIQNSWLASNLGAAPSRDNIQFVASRNSSVTGCTIVNHRVGINIDSTSKAIDISSCSFEGGTNNDILITNNSNGISCSNNKHLTNITISGTNAPIYPNSTGVDYVIVTDNIFKNASFTITVPGGNTTQTGNLFSWPG